jgi:hypothetical protein
MKNRVEINIVGTDNNILEAKIIFIIYLQFNLEEAYTK